MTPAQYSYHPCPTCGVLAREDWPHAKEFCERHLASLKRPESVRWPYGFEKLPTPKFQGLGAWLLNNPGGVVYEPAPDDRPPPKVTHHTAEGVTLKILEREVRAAELRLLDGLPKVGAPDIDEDEPVTVDVDALWAGT